MWSHYILDSGYKKTLAIVVAIGLDLGEIHSFANTLTDKLAPWI